MIFIKKKRMRGDINWKYQRCGSTIINLTSHAHFTIVSSAAHLLHGIIEKTYMDLGNS